MPKWRWKYLADENVCVCVCVFVTSDREGAVVSSVYDEAVHMQGDRRRLGVGGIVPGTVVLQQEMAHM